MTAKRSQSVSASMSHRPHAGELDRRSVLKMGAFGLVAFGGIPLLSACSSSGTPSSGGKSGSSSAQPLKPLRLHWSAGDTFLPDAVAIDQGIFKDHGLDVGTNVETQSGVQTLQLMSSGAVDGALVDQILAMNAFLKTPAGKRCIQVGQRYPANSYGVVVSGKGDWPADNASFADKVKSLRGKRVGVTSIGSGADQQLRLALELIGLNDSDVTRLAVGLAPAGAAQMKADRIDAYLGYSVSVSYFIAAQAGGRVMALFADDTAPDMVRNQSVGSLIMPESFVKENPDTVIKYLQAEAEANKWIADHQTQAATILNKSFNGEAQEASEKAVTFFAEKVIGKTQPQLKVTKDSFDTMAKVADYLGVIKAGTVTYDAFVAPLARA